jgi:hypothetical protein
MENPNHSMSQEEIDNNYSQAQIQAGLGQANQSQATAQYYYQEQEKNLAETQLEVDSIKEEIYHLLRQDVLRISPEGNQVWEAIKIKEERTLTDWGVDRIMQMIHFYINKNTLLSNFDEKQIKTLMSRFVGELNDLVLMKYEVLFREPTLEECKKIFNDRLDEKKKLKMFAAEILNIKIDSEQVKKDVLNEMQNKIEEEIAKIRTEQRKQKLREYGMIMSQLEAMVYATYNRAFRGEERGSIRRHTQISELIGGRGGAPAGDKGGMMKWLTRS